MDATSPGRRSGRGPLRWVVVVALLAGTAVTIVKLWPQPGPAPIRPICLASTPGGTYSLDLDQAANAATIAVAAKRLGLADHAVTVGLAAALQESALHNLDHGDRDSLGLFQQRQSEGWGPPSQTMDPLQSSLAFFRHLSRIPGWETLPVAVAAQDVQHSAAPDAYADWEDQARVIASAMTGEVSGGFSCRYPTPAASRARTSGRMAAFAALYQAQVGRAPALAASNEKDGWVAASWVVGHAQQFGLRAVTFDGRRWTSTRLSWRAAPSSDLVVRTVPSAER